MINISRRAFIHGAVAASVPISATTTPVIAQTSPKPSAFLPLTSLPEIYFDDDGLIVHRGPEGGGDTAQREGWYWFGVWIREKILGDPWPFTRKLSFAQVIKLLDPKQDGIFYRHPKQTKFSDPYSLHWGFTRDQMISLVAAMGVWDDSNNLRSLWNALPQDTVGGTRHTFNGGCNILPILGKVCLGNVVKPDLINLYRRSINEDPMLASDGNGPFGEADLAANTALTFVPFAKDRDSVGDDLNLMIMLLMSILRHPSTVSGASSRSYASQRLVSYGSYLGKYRAMYGVNNSISKEAMIGLIEKGIAEGWVPDADTPPALGAARWYHREETGANPRLAELYAPIIRKYFS